ncbi:IS1182 family transposase [Paenibacillus psychroresistens]|uniref:IS1182 family transposase n=1 Tax=Paenibacillus psychroresistens TaxID=1778678 RepID=A0A6B8RUM7_9BACL|nr:IS1182 family transposase [Paenibacillus psychroresistens]
MPESHLLRKIHEVVDFSFVHELVRFSYCEYYGRPANEPELLFRLLFLQILYGLSDERMIQDAQVNLAYKWFVGLNPEEALPDASQLSRFRNHRLGASQIDELLKVIVKQCIEKGLIKSKALILDSTHSLAASQKQRALDVLRDAAKRLLRTVVKKHPKLEKKLPRQPELKKDQADAEKVMLHYLAQLGESVEMLLPDHEGAISEKLQIAKQIVEDERLLANKGIMSAIDPEARFGWKSNTKSFFGYKNHIAMTEEEIITAVEVTGGSSDDGKQLPNLLKQSLELGLEVKEILGDTAYSGKDNLAKLKAHEIQAIIPLNPIVHNGGLKQEGFEYNKDADFVLCPAGEHSIRKALQGSKTSGNSRSLVFYFNVEKCKTCPLREGCYKPESKSKTYSIRIIVEQFKDHMAFEKSESFNKRMKRRPIIEHKNAELKRHHGLAKAKYRGLFRMRMQTLLTIFVVNVKRMIKLMDKMQPTS